MIRYAIIVAGGSGSRFGSEIPKQFLLLAGKPVLANTLERFFATDPTIQLIVVLPSSEISRWKKLIQTHSIQTPHTIVEGGKSRFQSVHNGLKSIPNTNPTETLVAIHDGVRPLISPDIIERSFVVAAEKGSAVVAVPSKDSMRILSGDTNQALDRSLLRIIQTPQTFQFSILLNAFEHPERPDFTDDASVVEAAGFSITLVEGNYSNLKITTPEDLKIAETLLKVV